jgi:type VI secretion system protein ImpA
MPLSDDLLSPISGSNPSGRNLRYLVYDAIREARRADDELPAGDWARERKRADYPLVLRLCCDALAEQSKDLQLAVWATEASLKLEGLSGLQRGLDFLNKLTETFWETLYPEIEDGDIEERSAILDSLDGKFTEQLWYLPLTAEGLTWLQYKESRTVGYEADVVGNDEKAQARGLAINEGKITPEIFDKAVSRTPKEFYEQRLKEADACLKSLEALNQTCSNRFGDASPSFAKLRDGLEDTHQSVSVLLRRKREGESEPRPAELAEAAGDQGASTVEETVRDCCVADSPSVLLQAVSKEPENVSDAIERIILAAHYLRRQQPWSPVAYLVLRALRWGELRANVENMDLSLLEAPSTEVRKQLRALLQSGDWEELLDACELAIASPCGRGWLDLQRYVVRACDGLGSSYTPVSAAILSALDSLLSDYPQLAQSSLNDETATANPETQSWLQELTDSKQQPCAEALATMSAVPETVGLGYKEAPDSYELAKQAARSGNLQDAIEILEREAAHERSGRGRFQRRMQLAQICMSAGHKTVAFPILEALASEIDKRNLEDWEDPDLVIRALGLLYQCMEKLKCSTEQKEKVYARICRLGPAQALELVK